MTDERGQGEVVEGWGEGGQSRQIEGITQKENLSMQAQEKWLSDVNQGSLRVKWASETQAEGRWTFPGSFLSSQPSES